MDRHALLDALERETAAVADLLRTADLAVPVAACPDWDIRALAEHLLGVHRLAHTSVVEDVLREDPAPPVPDRTALVAAYSAGAGALVKALRATPAGTPCPGFGPRPRTVDFWVRRQPHETAVHRWDAELAAGGAPALDSALSADGVAEVVDVLLPRQLHLGRTPPLAHAVALERTDGEGRWLLGDGEPSAVVRADAPTLLLLLWRRVHLDPAVVDGDAVAARAVLASALTP